MIAMLKEWYRRYAEDPQIIILFAIPILGLVLILTMGDMLAPVIAAIVIAYLLEGLINILERLKVSRMIALTTVFILFIAGLVIVILFLLPMLSRQIAQMFQDLPALMANGQKQLVQLPERYPELVSRDQIDQIIDFLTSEFTQLGQYLLSVSVASIRTIITMMVVYLILVPLMVFFFLKDKLKILNWLRLFMPKSSRLAAEVWKEVNQQIANYVRGKIWEIIIVWTTSYILFAALGLKFAILISLAVGLSVLAPYIGATLMFFPVAIVAFFQWGISPHFTWPVISYLILQALDGNLLAPLLLSEVVDIHPVAIIVALLVFGGIWGMWGLFFAIPLATLVNAVMNTWFRYIGEKNQPTADPQT